MGYLSTEQVLLLENLMYLSDSKPLKSVSGYEGYTIEEYLNQIDVSKLDMGKEYGSYMTGEDWKNTINAVKNDPELCKMTIAATHTDSADLGNGGGGGKSAVFTNPDTNEAVVAFRGTAQNEWKDDFVGGATTDTQQQENALDWYQQVYDELGLEDSFVTVTGHSKGGNKAKYITVLDSSVDRCVSFDGQGFSDDFMDKYSDQIAANQNKIENHNVDYDYVNLLLNDIGNTTYYKGFDYGDGGFLENHCPNTFFKFDENGNPMMVVNPDGQAPEMKALDEFLNSYLRSLSPQDRADALDLIGTLVQGGFGGEMDGSLADILWDPDNQDQLAYLLAYLVEYEQAHPEFADQIKDVMDKFGMGDFTQYVDTVTGVLNWKYFDKLMGFLEWGLDKIPDFLWNKLLEYLEKEFGVKLTLDQLKQLIGLVGTLNDYMDDIEIKDNGGDIKIADSSFGSVGQIRVNQAILKQGVSDLQSLASQMRSIRDQVDAIEKGLDFSNFGISIAFHLFEDRIEHFAGHYDRLASVLETVVNSYEKEEEEITKLFNLPTSIMQEALDEAIAALESVIS